MQLLFKTIIIMAIGLLVLGTASVLMQNRFQEFLGEQLIDDLTKDRQYLWENILDIEERNIITRAEELHNAEELQSYLSAGDLQNLSTYLLGRTRFMTGNGDFKIAVFNAAGDIIYNSDNRLNSRAPLPNTEVDSVLSGEQWQLSGLGYDDRLEMFQTIVVAVKYRDEIVGAIAYSQKMDKIFDELKKLIDSDIFVVNRFYRPVAGENNPLWIEFASFFESVDIKGLYSAVADNGQSYRIIKFPVTDMFGSLQAFAVTMNNVSDEYKARRNLSFILNAIFLAVGLIIIVVVTFILRNSFRPLGEGSGFLVSLAKSEDINSLGNEFNDDEVGHILNAIETLRLRTIYLKRLRRSRSKQRQRVHSLLLREMSSLAGNLDSDARTDIIEDLQAVKNEIGRHRDLSQEDRELREESGNELVTVASAFRKLAFRVTEKQKHLNQVIRDLEEALKTEVAYLALQKELNLAHDVQLSFIPDVGLKMEQVDLLGYMQPAKTVGGDLFDYFVIDEEHVGFCVGDVSDKGVPAALFMMVARIVLWLIARSESSVGKALADVNNAIHDNNPNNFFVSIFYGRINVKTGKIDYACAGHPPAIFIGKDSKQAVEVEADNNLVAGIFPDVEYTEHSITLSPGDSLFIYSDGISEAMNINDEQYTPERLLKILGENRRATVAEIIDVVIKDVKDFTGESPQSDDITCIALRYNEVS